MNSWTCLHAACGIAHGKTTRLEFASLQLVATFTGHGVFDFEIDNPAVPLRNFLTGSPDPILEIWVDSWLDDPYEAVRYVFPTRRWWRTRALRRSRGEGAESKIRSSTLANERCDKIGEIEFTPMGGFELIERASIPSPA